MTIHNTVRMTIHSTVEMTSHEPVLLRKPDAALQLPLMAVSLSPDEKR